MKIFARDNLLDLLKRISDKDVESFYLFYDKTNLFVFNVALSILCDYNLSNDISQNVYTIIFQLSKDNLPKYNAISWLRTLTRNEAISYMRKNKICENIEDYTCISTHDSFVNELLDKASFDYILRYLNSEEREIVILKTVNSFSHKEIAKILNIPQGTVRWRYSMAIKKLREILGDDYI